jgi:uncharacterized membrane protein
MSNRHPVNRKLVDEAPLGSRIADKVTGFMGSWRFIIIQTIVVAAWVVGNVYLIFHFDAYPFIFLNLAFSTQAAYAAPLILLASNRAAVRDRLTLEHAADQADVEEKQNERLLRGNTEILKKVESLEERILGLEKHILDAVEGRPHDHDGQASGDTGSGSPPA